MVLAAMKARELVEQGRQEGRQQGRQEARDRLNQAFEQFGTEINGVLTLQLTPEVQRFLAGEDQ
jgi:flagellar biosynthesis/type III secretory pathway protein FliH